MSFLEVGSRSRRPGLAFDLCDRGSEGRPFRNAEFDRHIHFDVARGDPGVGASGGGIANLLRPAVSTTGKGGERSGLQQRRRRDAKRWIGGDVGRRRPWTSSQRCGIEHFDVERDDCLDDRRR